MHQDNYPLVIAIIAGFLLAPLATYTQPFIVPFLVITLTLSISNVDLSKLVLKSLVKPITMALFLNFIVLGGAIVLFGHLFTDDYNLRAGFLVLAVAPASLAIPLFTHKLKGNSFYSFVGIASCFLASIILLPLIIKARFGNEIDSRDLLITLGQLIVLPLILSQLRYLSNIWKRTESYHRQIINWCIAIICFSMIGINRDMIFTFPKYVVAPFLVAVITTFGLGYLILTFGKKLLINESSIVSMVLLGTMKKWALASVIAFKLFEPIATLPAVFGIVIGFIFFIWLNIRKAWVEQYNKIQTPGLK